MKVQEYLKENGLQSLISEFNIKANVYENEKLVVLNYHQIKSPKFHPIVDECRALILELDTWKLVSRSFSRFYNYGEGGRFDFDFDKSLIYEKVDGSLMSVYFHKFKWNVGSRGMAFAEGKSVSGYTFAEIFSEAFSLSDLDKYPKNWCFSFELVSPKSRIVKKYAFTDVYLLAMFDKDTGKEFPQSHVDKIASELKVMRPKLYGLNGDIFESFKSLETMDEGYVCVIDDNGDIQRIKVKNPGYLAIANLRINGAISPKRICWLIVNNEHEEYLLHFPEDKELFKPYDIAYKTFVEQIERLWKIVKGIEDQKDFALRVQQEFKDCTGLLFEKRKNPSISFNELIVKAKIDSVTEWLQRRMENKI